MVRVLIVNPYSVPDPLSYQREQEAAGNLVHFRLSADEPLPPNLIKRGRNYYLLKTGRI